MLQVNSNISQITKTLNLGYQNTRELNQIIDDYLPGCPQFHCKPVHMGQSNLSSIIVQLFYVSDHSLGMQTLPAILFSHLNDTMLMKTVLSDYGIICILESGGGIPK